MKRYYSLLPIDFDYDKISEKKWVELREMKVLTVFDIEGVKEHCGSLYPIVQTEKFAISYAKGVKKQFPEVKFGLYIGKTWGEMELIKEF